MTSLSKLSYGERAERLPHPVARKVLRIAEEKQTNLVISADLKTTAELLECANGLLALLPSSSLLKNVRPYMYYLKLWISHGIKYANPFIVALGPYIAVLKLHIDMLSDLNSTTITGLRSLAEQHKFLIFEDRKFIDIGHTVQPNLSVLSGDGIVEALGHVVRTEGFPYVRALILAEKTSKGSLATGSYTQRSVELGRLHSDCVIGFVATKELGEVGVKVEGGEEEDFLVFTTGVNLKSKGDALGQQYQIPSTAVEGGADFIIAGRGIYAAGNREEAAREYRKEGWEAYWRRIGQGA